MVQKELLEESLAAKAVAPRVSKEEMEAQIQHVEYVKHVSPTGQVLRWCVITTKNGFAVTGRPSAAVNPENDDPKFGEPIAYKNATDLLWGYLGFELRSRTALIEQAPAPQDKMALLFGSEVKTYIGTKVVHATPMNRVDYNNFRGWKLPADENGADEGYLVEYTDGGSPNMVGFTGYISWSPRDVFERAYATGTKPKKETFVSRMRQEAWRLGEDIRKLTAFIDGPVFQELPTAERTDLTEQLHHMNEHNWVLQRRLKRQGVLG
jgi:hypothetical protein